MKSARELNVTAADTYQEEIKKYEVSYNGCSLKSAHARALIGLHRKDNTNMGTIYFHRDATTLPASDERDSNGNVSCHLLWQDFPMILDLLRNERPVYLRYVAGGYHTASITTNWEPAGVGDESGREPS